MADLNNPCLACEIVAGCVRPPAGVVARWPGFVLHPLTGPCPIPGWLVLTTERHARGLYDLTEAESARLGVLVSHVQRAQREALGADHAYAVVLGDALHHVHVHLIPRMPGTPENLRGARALLADPKDARPLAEIEKAAAAVGAVLSKT